jgi:hypothetical protein
MKRRFVHLNQQRRPLGKLDLFKAAVASGDTEAEIVAALVPPLSVAPHMNPISWVPGALGNGIGARPAGGAMGPTSPGWRSAARRLRRPGPACRQHLPRCFRRGRQKPNSSGPLHRQVVAALITMIRSKTQDEWRSAMLMARAHDRT